MPNDTALVTGANKGIGRAIAAQLADAGLLTPEQGARVPVQVATLPADGPTGTFAAPGADGGITSPPW